MMARERVLWQLTVAVADFVNARDCCMHSSPSFGHFCFIHKVLCCAKDGSIGNAGAHDSLTPLSSAHCAQEPWCDPLADGGDAAGEEEGGGDSPPSPLEAASLTEIDLSGCESLSDSAVGSLAALFPHMTSLSLAVGPPPCWNSEFPTLGGLSPISASYLWRI
jgi:hypothetical protein